MTLSPLDSPLWQGLYGSPRASAALDDAAGAAVVRRRADIFTLHVEAAWSASHD